MEERNHSLYRELILLPSLLSPLLPTFLNELVTQPRPQDLLAFQYGSGFIEKREDPGDEVAGHRLVS